MKTGTMSRSRSIATGLTYFFLIVGSLLMIFPFVWMILTSLKSLSESVQIPPTIFPCGDRVDQLLRMRSPACPLSTSTSTPSSWYWCV